MSSSPDRICTTHVGSLIRPPELTKYIEAIDNGVVVDQPAFDRCLAGSVAEVVRRQQQAGVDIVSDGEFGKFRSWSFYVLDRLGGIEERAVKRREGRDEISFCFRISMPNIFRHRNYQSAEPQFASARSRTKARPRCRRILPSLRPR